MTTPSLPPDVIAGLPLQTLWAAAEQHAIVSIADARGDILYANDMFCAISGYGRHELIGRNHRIVNSGVHPKKYFAQLWQTITRGEIWNGEICNRHRSGGLYWVYATIMPVLDASGLPTHYISLRTDITNEKRQLEAMRQMERAENELLRLAPVGIARLRNRVFVKANAEFHRMLGYHDDELIGNSTRVIYRSEADFVLAAQLAYEPLKRGEQAKYEQELRCKDGSPLFVIAGICSLNRDDPTKDTLFVVQDITKHRLLERDLAEAARKAQALSQAKSEFMAIISHELKTPLHGILGNAQLLEMSCADTEAPLIGDIRHSSTHLLGIIDGIIEYASYDLRTPDQSSEPSNLAHLLFMASEKYSILAEQKGLRFEMAIAETCDREFVVEPKYVIRVIAAVLDNAVKFTSEGAIALSAALQPASTSAPALTVTITDTGVGMDEQALAKVFVPFQQGEAAATRAHGGLGLGLALAKKLMDRLDGSIDVASRPGQGTTVRLSFPLPAAHNN